MAGNPNAVNDYGTTALILASLNGHADIVKTLLDRGVKPSHIERVAR
jgi:ankyrin repeat protein